MKTVVVLSGGLDSSVLLLAPPDDLEVVAAITIDYGQRHHKEIEAALVIAEIAEAPHQIVDMSNLQFLLGGSALTDEDVDVPHGHYEDESMKATVVPNRNMILLALAAGYAISIGAKVVAYGAHAGDHVIYPDCRPEFVRAMMEPLALCHYEPIQLRAPFIDIGKAAIVAHAARAGVAKHLVHTWSCYKGEQVHCGECGTCVERRQAFNLAGFDDPTLYKVTA